MDISRSLNEKSPWKSPLSAAPTYTELFFHNQKYGFLGPHVPPLLKHHIKTYYLTTETLLYEAHLKFPSWFFGMRTRACIEGTEGGTWVGRSGSEIWPNRNVRVAGNVVGIDLQNPFEKQAGGMSCLENVDRGERERVRHMPEWKTSIYTELLMLSKAIHVWLIWDWNILSNKLDRQ